MDSMNSCHIVWVGFDFTKPLKNTNLINAQLSFHFGIFFYLHTLSARLLPRNIKCVSQVKIHLKMLVSISVTWFVAVGSDWKT